MILPSVLSGSLVVNLTVFGPPTKLPWWKKAEESIYLQRWPMVNSNAKHNNYQNKGISAYLNLITFLHQKSKYTLPCANSWQGLLCLCRHRFDLSVDLPQSCQDLSHPMKSGNRFPDCHRFSPQREPCSQRIWQCLSWWQFLTHAHLVGVDRFLFVKN